MKNTNISMEKDYSDWNKYSVEFEKTYVIPNEKGMTKLIAIAKAIEMFSNMIRAIEKEDEKRRREEPEGEAMKFLMSLETKKEGRKLTIKNQVSLFDVIYVVEKTSIAKNYIIVFRYKFNLLTKIADRGLVRAIAQKESLSKFSINVQNALNMKVILQ